MKFGIITQARTTSTRLPAKVLLQAGGKSVLDHHITRLMASGLPVYVATTTNSTDDPIVSFCEAKGIPYHRGSENNVLSRFYNCAKENNLDVITRATSDCPLIDGSLIREAVSRYEQSPRNSYISNCLTRTYPRGMDYEVFSFQALSKAFNESNDPYEQEHVSTFIRDPNKNVGVHFLSMERPQDASHFRITLDEEADWLLIQQLIEKYNAAEKDAESIISILEQNPQLSALNSHVEQKKHTNPTSL